MQRTNIFLEERQTAALDDIAEVEGVSRAEVIRRIIDRALANDAGGGQALTAAIDYSFGALATEAELVELERSPGTRAVHLAAMWDR